MKKLLTETQRMLELNRFLTEGRLDEKTPNQIKHPRPRVGQTTKYKSSGKWNQDRVNTISSDEMSSNEPVYDHGPHDIVKSGPRKGKLTKDDQKWKKDIYKTIRRDRASDTEPNSYMSDRMGREAKPWKPKSSYKKSGVGR